MKKMIFIGLGLVLITATSCTKGNDITTDCIHCNGCFSSWDECADSYRPTEPNPMTWEEHSDYMVNNPSGATWVCERTQ